MLRGAEKDAKFNNPKGTFFSDKGVAVIHEIETGGSERTVNRTE